MDSSPGSCWNLLGLNMNKKAIKCHFPAEW